MSDKNEIHTTENVVFRQGKRSALKRHCVRFWWLHVIIFVLVAVFLILISIFVAVPRIAQSKVNAAKLEIDSVRLTNPLPTSYQLAIDSSIYTDGTVKATFEPFEGIMYLPDAPDKSPFATIQIPRASASRHSTFRVDQPVAVTESAALEQFSAWFVANETIRIAVSGDTLVQPAGLSRQYPVSFHKVVETRGLNLFRGMRIVDPKIQLALDDGSDANFRNFHATAVIPNPSRFTLEIGNATFANSFLGADLGRLYIENLLLVPGDNTVQVSGNLKQTQALALVSSNKPYCETGKAPFSLVGVNVTRNGLELPYFSYALANANQTIELDISETLKNSGIPMSISCIG